MHRISETGGARVSVSCSSLHVSETRPVSLSDDPPSRGGRAPGSQANGSFPKGTGRLSEKSPAGYPPPHHRDDTPGSAGVPPACCPFGCRSVSLRCCSRPPCRREPHGPGRSRGRAPLPVDSDGGRPVAMKGGRICAGGTPALPERGIRGPNLPETIEGYPQRQKEESTKGHEGPRRKIRRGVTGIDSGNPLAGTSVNSI